MRKKLKFLLALAGLIGCYACTQDNPAGPTGVAPSPSPSPTPVPVTDVASCVQHDLKLSVQNGAGNDDYLFGVDEYVNSIAVPVNRAGARLLDKCDFIRVVGWQGSGAGLKQYGDLTGFSTLWKGIETGDISILAVHGEFKAVWAGRLIRSAKNPQRLVVDAENWELRTFRSGEPVSVTIMRNGVRMEVLR